MSEVKFTKGEWRASISASNVIDVKRGDEEIIHWSGFDCCDTELAETKANAHLIAAAPEMYDTLKTIVLVMDGKTEFNIDDLDTLAVDDLLAKARGEL